MISQLFAELLASLDAAADIINRSANLSIADALSREIVLRSKDFDEVQLTQTFRRIN